jgi:DNA-binding GntR family transcriptional regulator
VHKLSRSKNDEPLYLQVARALREDIVKGVLPVGSQLPTEDRLCESFAVSRHTVREALRRLREDGLVASKQGAGTVVISPRSSQSELLHAVSINDLASLAQGRRFSISSMEMEPVDGELAAQLGVDPGETWLVVRGIYRKLGDDQPDCWADYYINREFAAVGRILHHHSGPVFTLIEDLFGQTIAEVRQEITATVISRKLAATLEVKSGTAAVVVQRAYKTTTGQIAQVTVGTHPVSRFHHSMTLQRVKS